MGALKCCRNHMHCPHVHPGLTDSEVHCKGTHFWCSKVGSGWIKDGRGEAGRSFKKFGDKIVVDNLNLEIKDGEFLCLLGPSGAGKTTTLRIIAGVEKPDSGTVYIDDAPVNDLPPKDRHVALMFQSYALYPHMTVYNNLAYPLRKMKASKIEIDRRVRKVAEMLGIGKLLERLPKHLSGGEKQRVALGRAIIKNPKVCLLDEPLTNLDAKLRVQMRAELKRLCSELKIAHVMATPDQLEAITIADRIAVMNNGRILQVGTPEELYEKPENLFVAGFIGSPPMNFVDCSLVEKAGKLYLDAGVFTYDITDLAELVKERATSHEVVLGVRPEYITLSGERRKDAIRGKISLWEPMGHRAIVHVDIDGISLTVNTTALELRKAGVIWAIFDRNKIHIFDKKSEELIV